MEKEEMEKMEKEEKEEGGGRRRSKWSGIGLT